MTVRDADSGAVIFGPTVSSASSTSANLLTVGAAATLLIVGVEIDTSTPGTVFMNWNPAGTNQAMTLIGSIVTQIGGVTNPITIALFGLVNPTSGLHPVSVIASGQATGVQSYLYAISFTGSVSSSVAAATEGFASATAATGTTMAVTSAVSIPSGDMATAWWGDAQGFTGTFVNGAIQADGGTAVGKNESLTNNAAAEYYSGAGSAIAASAAGNASGGWIAMIVGIVSAGGTSGGAAVVRKNFKVDKFKTPLRSMGPNAGLFQVKAFPIVTPAAVVETNIHWQGRTYAPQWNRNALLLSGTSQDFTYSAVETNPHWQGRTWSRQWNINDSPNLLWNSAGDVSVTPTVDDPTYFVPRLWRPQWNVNDSPSLLWNSTGDIPPTVDAPLPFISKIWPPQWILNKILRQNTAQDFSSSAVETNVHFVSRIWPLQWLAYRALWQNPATDAQVVVIPPDAPTYFTPVQFPWQWVINLLLTTSPANDATSSVIETNPQWVGRVYPRQWQAQPSLWQVLATDAPVVASQSDTPSYFIPRQLPAWWGVNRLLGRNTANDFSSSAVDTPSYQNPKAWPPQWASKWNVNMLLTRGTAQDFSSTPPVSTAIEWYVRYRRRGR